MRNNSYLDQVSRKSEQYHAKYGKNPWKANCVFWLWNLVQLFKFNRPMRPKADNVCRIGFLLKGGIGDILLSLNYLQNLHRFLDEEFVFDVYVSTKRGVYETIRTVCRDQNFVGQVLPKHQLRRDYDLFAEIVRYPKILHFNEQKIGALFPKFHQWCLLVDKFCRDNPIVYHYGTHGDFVGIGLAKLQGRNRIQQADVGNLVHVESVFSPRILADTQETLAKYSLAGKRFVTLQRGVGGGDRNNSTRLWPLEHYEALAALIKKRIPEVFVVQVGTENSLAIRGVDMDLRSKTSFEDVMVLMRESSCHIDGECGLVHLRHFLSGGTSIVLFGPTDEGFYGYEENVNMRHEGCPGGCEWMNAVYTHKCVRGLAENECLTKLSPESVLIKVMETLESSVASMKYAS